MKSIQRYTLPQSLWMNLAKSPDGDLMHYADHVRELAALQKQLAGLREERFKLRILVEHALKLEIIYKHDCEPDSTDYAACNVNIERYRAALNQGKAE